MPISIDFTATAGLEPIRDTLRELLDAFEWTGRFEGVKPLQQGASGTSVTLGRHYARDHDVEGRRLVLKVGPRSTIQRELKGYRALRRLEPSGAWATICSAKITSEVAERHDPALLLYAFAADAVADSTSDGLSMAEALAEVGSGKRSLTSFETLSRRLAAALRSLHRHAAAPGQSSQAAAYVNKWVPDLLVVGRLQDTGSAPTPEHFRDMTVERYEAGRVDVRAGDGRRLRIATTQTCAVGQHFDIDVAALETREEALAQVLGNAMNPVDLTDSSFSVAGRTVPNPLVAWDAPLSGGAPHDLVAPAHGDLHPGNVLVVGDVPVIIDFGEWRSTAPPAWDGARLFGGLLRELAANLPPHEIGRMFLGCWTNERPALSLHEMERTYDALRVAWRDLADVYGSEQLAWELYGWALIAIKPDWTGTPQQRAGCLVVGALSAHFFGCTAAQAKAALGPPPFVPYSNGRELLYSPTFIPRSPEALRAQIAKLNLDPGAGDVWVQSAIGNAGVALGMHQEVLANFDPSRMRELADRPNHFFIANPLRQYVEVLFAVGRLRECRDLVMAAIHHARPAEDIHYRADLQRLAHWALAVAEQQADMGLVVAVQTALARHGTTLNDWSALVPQIGHHNGDVDFARAKLHDRSYPHLPDGIRNLKRDGVTFATLAEAQLAFDRGEEDVSAALAAVVEADCAGQDVFRTRQQARVLIALFERPADSRLGGDLVARGNASGDAFEQVWGHLILCRQHAARRAHDQARREAIAAMDAALKAELKVWLDRAARELARLPTWVVPRQARDAMDWLLQIPPASLPIRHDIARLAEAEARSHEEDARTYADVRTALAGRLTRVQPTDRNATEE